MIRLVTIAAIVFLTGCDGGEHRDLQLELAEMSKDLRGRVDPLPAVRPYAAYSYTSFELPEPFSPAKLKLDARAESSQGANADVAAFHQNRPKEPLEAYPLETLKMVGTLERGPNTQALVKADKGLFRVKVGGYLGQNFGLVTKITGGEVVLKELVQDGTGDWAERVSSLQLQEAEAKGK
jgi:type IV pilus assembly protein PilP